MPAIYKAIQEVFTEHANPGTGMESWLAEHLLADICQ